MAKTATRTLTESVAPSDSYPEEHPSWLRRLWNRTGAIAGSPTAPYYWIIAATVALTGIGLMAVLSASSAESISEGQDPYSLFIKESMFAISGFVIMLALSMLPPSFFKKSAWLILGFSILLLMLVVFTPLGKTVQGNRNWLNLGDTFTFQPSEAAKLALAIWIGMVLARKGPLVRDWKHTLIPVVPAAIIVVGLVLLGHDLGTAVIVMAVVGAGIFFGGGSKRVLFGAIVLGGAAAGVLATMSGNRTSRLDGWLGNCDNGLGLCDQAQNGIFALASGRFFGVGLGQSRQKWSWIPEAHNDFIFAILGEELGLLGTLVIIALYAVLAFSIFRVVIRRNDTFARVVGGSILAWIIGQAFVNIAMVVGLLPVIGVPLPLISYGGSSLMVTLAAIGVVLSFARTQKSDVAEPNSAITQESTYSLP